MVSGQNIKWMVPICEEHSISVEPSSHALVFLVGGDMPLLTDVRCGWYDMACNFLPLPMMVVFKSDVYVEFASLCCMLNLLVWVVC